MLPSNAPLGSTLVTYAVFVAALFGIMSIDRAHRRRRAQESAGREDGVALFEGRRPRSTS